MPITREALGRLERILDAIEKAHDAEIVERTLAMTDGEIKADLRAWGLEPDKFVEELRRKLGLDSGKAPSARAAGFCREAPGTKRSRRRQTGNPTT